MTAAAYPMTIYYDASCRLCSAEISNLRLRDTRGCLNFVDASEPGFTPPMAGITQADLMTVIHGVQADGQIARGVEVFRLAYAGVGLGWLAAPTAWPVLRQLADRAYPWLVRNRHRIPAPLVALVFEGPARRAAQRARCTEQTCQR